MSITPIQHAGEPLIAELEALIEEAAAADGHRSIGEHAGAELRRSARMPHAGFVAREAGTLVGYAHMSKWRTPHGWRLEVCVAPEARRRGHAARLVAAALHAAAAEGQPHVHLWAYRPAEAQEAMAAEFGALPLRRLLCLAAELPVAAGPAEAPPGFVFRHPTEDDLPGWLELHNQAFAEHPDSGHWTEEMLRWQLETDWFDPEGVLLAERDGRLEGYIWMRAGSGDAWLNFLGVLPSARGSGLGRRLTAAGLEWASSRARRCLLYVDEANTAAVRLYRSLGFTEDHVDICYEAPTGAL
jgi:mycothiol synthase